MNAIDLAEQARAAARGDRGAAQAVLGAIQDPEAAHRLMESGQARGKIVVRTPGE